MSGSAPVNVYLPAGHFYFGGGRVRVKTLLGTCVAIAIWHPINRIGGLSHFLLPSRQRNSVVDAAMPGLYAQDVMGLFVRALRTSNTVPSGYVVKVAGGGNMFPHHLMPVSCRGDACTDARRVDCPSIGCKNISAAQAMLAEAGFPITSQNVGGQGSRQVIFELWSGEMWIKRGAANGPMSSSSLWKCRAWMG